MLSSPMENFKKIKILGIGSIWKVILVEDESRKRFVIKKISNACTFSPQIQERIIENFNSMKNISHPNIIKYIDIFKTSKNIYCVLEYADGGDLSQMIKKYRTNQKAFTEEKIILYFEQIALAVQYIHNHNIIHRDLKPQNIFLMQQDIIKLGDFDDIKILETIHQRCTSFSGTKNYMSPELINFKSYDYKTDIWSLGCVLYELCSLEPPFHGNLSEIRKSITKGKYKPISNYYSDTIKNLISKMLSLNPKNRPTIDEIVSILQNPKPSKVQNFNIFIFGCESSGKCSLVKKYLKINDLNGHVDYFRKTFVYQKNRYEYHIYICDTDTDSTSIKKLPKIHATIYVFSVENRKGFENIGKYCNDFLPNANFHYLCANKVDLNDRCISSEEVKEFANNINIPYFETSAVTGKGVVNMFTHIVNKEIQTKNSMEIMKKIIYEEGSDELVPLIFYHDIVSRCFPDWKKTPTNSWVMMNEASRLEINVSNFVKRC